MKTFKILGLTALTAVSLGLTTQAMAETYTDHTYKKDMYREGMYETEKYASEAYSTRNDIDGITRYDLWTNQRLQDKLTTEQEVELSNYFEREERDPCQNYMAPPEGFVRVDCELTMIQPAAQPKPMKQAPKSKILNTYDINFDFDSSALDNSAESTVSRIAREIKQHNPSEVVIAGHTDTAGPMSYNEKLSQERAIAVSKALTEMGVPNRILDKEAYGERDLAVATADSTPLRANRRVEVHFMK